MSETMERPDVEAVEQEPAADTSKTPTSGKKQRSESEKREILQEARDRFRRASDWEKTARTRFKDDVRFAEADAYNMWQWPTDIQQQRAKRVMLTVNRVRQHNLDILNDARQSRVAVQVRPLRGGASYDSAMILDGVIRHIEYVSNAESAYQAALKFAVQGGIGWIRLVTDYVGDDSFDQEIYIRGFYKADDVMMVLIDCDIKEFDGSDAKWGFVFTDMPKDEFDKKHPKLKDRVSSNEIAPEESWGNAERVRIAEYFRCVPQEGKLYTFVDPATGEEAVKKSEEMDKELLAAVIDTEGFAERIIIDTKVEHFKIIGDTIAEENVWPGKYIPLIRCVGEETVIDGNLDRKGHTRALIDSQRMFNYSASLAVEYSGLQTKTPFSGPAAAIEGYEEYWNTANVENHSYLPTKYRDDEGNDIPQPRRMDPPVAAPVALQGMESALQQMYLASGQNQADFGQPGNERSGVAIQQRQRQGDNATYHYLDHQASMVRFCGKQLLDLISKVYDTERMVKFRDDAGNESDVKIDPNAPQPMQKLPQDDKDAPEQVVLNPKMGVYDVQADVGPAYATRRQEAFTQFSTLLQSNKELISVVGDIWMRFADIPGGEEAAERLKRMVPKQALEDGPSPDLVAAQQQIQQLMDVVKQVTDKLASKEGEAKNAEEKNAVAGYDAVTKRISALEKALALDPAGLKVLVMEVLEEAQAQSAGGNALEHAMDDDPARADIHADLGGQLQGPEPHAPPIDPNKQVEPSATEAPEGG